MSVELVFPLGFESAAVIEMGEDRISDAVYHMMNIRQRDPSFLWHVFRPTQMKVVLVVYAKNDDHAHKRATWLLYNCPPFKGLKYTVCSRDEVAKKVSPLKSVKSIVEILREHDK